MTCDHVVTWDYKEPNIDIKENTIIIHGKCRVCETEFYKTCKLEKIQFVDKDRLLKDCDLDIIKENRN